LRSSYINRNLAKRLTQFWDSQCTSWLGNFRQSNTSARCESRTGTAIRLSRRWRCILVILAQVARRHERHGVLPSRAERKPTRKQHPSSLAAFILWAFGPMRRMRVMLTTAARHSLGFLFSGDQWASWLWFLLSWNNTIHCCAGVNYIKFGICT